MNNQQYMRHTEHTIAMCAQQWQYDVVLIQDRQYQHVLIQYRQYQYVLIQFSQ